MTNFKTILNTGKQFVDTNSPTILTGMAVGGFMASLYLSNQATLKANRLLEQKKIELGLQIDEELTPKETIQTCWKVYAPSFVLAGFSIACAVGANSINCRRNAALASAYAISSEALRTYKQKTEEVVGEKNTKKIGEKVAEAFYKDNPIEDSKIIDTGMGKILCVEALGGQPFYSSVAAIQEALNKANEELLNEGYIDLNGVYDYMGLRSTKLGRELGFEASDGLIRVSFDSGLREDHTPYLLVDFQSTPKFRYNYMC